MPRMSSGSSLTDSAVEPTKSQNMTVSWRRSALSCAGGRSGRRGLRGRWTRAAELPNCNQHPTAVAERLNAKVLEVLVG
jgi:hypothetical protein